MVGPGISTSSRLEPLTSRTAATPTPFPSFDAVFAELGGQDLVAIVFGSSLVLGLATALSVGDAAELGPILSSGLAYLPAELVLAGLALAVYGLQPRLFAIAWAGYAVMTFIAFLGPGLKFHQWVLDLSPTTHVGNPPLGAIQTGALAAMTGVAVALVAVGFAAFRRRGIPQG